MSLLEGSAKLHQFVEDFLLEILDECQENSRKFYLKISSEDLLHKAFIDLILEHKWDLN